MVPVATIDGECAKRWGTLQRWFDRYELDEVTLQAGTTKSSGESGDVVFDRPTGGVRLIATAPDRFAAVRVADAEPAVATLRLHADASVEFHVVDEHGKPVGGIPVAVGWGMDDPIDTAWPAAFDGVVVSRALDGVARFPHAGEWLAAEPKSSELALLAFPVANRIELRFGSAAADARRELVVPPLGRVVLSFPGVARGVAQLRNDAVGEHGMRPSGATSSPARAAIVDGKATFRSSASARNYSSARRGRAFVAAEGLLDGPQHVGDRRVRGARSRDDTVLRGAARRRRRAACQEPRTRVHGAANRDGRQRQRRELRRDGGHGGSRAIHAGRGGARRRPADRPDHGLLERQGLEDRVGGDDRRSHAAIRARSPRPR
jgi:hypothetical protein